MCVHTDRRRLSMAIVTHVPHIIRPAKFGAVEDCKLGAVLKDQADVRWQVIPGRLSKKWRVLQCSICSHRAIARILQTGPRKDTARTCLHALYRSCFVCSSRLAWQKILALNQMSCCRPTTYYSLRLKLRRVQGFSSRGRALHCARHQPSPRLLEFRLHLGR
jgi:hypothetical protein